jgi:murein DD-endopeptidase MepM/ murein hydrolase activator NlpD
LHLSKSNNYIVIPYFRSIIIFVLFFGIQTYGQTDKSLFISPLKIPLSLSSNFGDLRADHFHSGIDIKTQSVTGKEVVASASGYIYLIIVSPVGFGRAIFIRHPSGYSTVYGHLDKFSPEIEEYIIAQQYSNKSFPVTIYPPKERFQVTQGEIIAYSGNSGSSFGPHLHYEIRKSDGEKPINPLFFSFGIEDNLMPVIENLAVYPENRYTSINNLNRETFISVSGSMGKYYLSGENELRIHGPAGFGIKSYDLMNNSMSRFGISSIELLIDSVSHF